MTSIINYRSAPFNGPFAMFASLCSAAAAPYEGVWVPWSFARVATVELEAGAVGGAVTVFGSNQDNPTNTYTLTVGGSVTTGDVIALAFKTTSGTITPSYTTIGGDTDATIATALAAAINANPALALLGIQASVASAVVTVTWPSVSPQAPTPAEFQSPSSPPPQNTLSVGYTKGGNSETITVATGTDGLSITTALATATPGPLALSPLPVRWVKARVTALSSGQCVVNLAGAA